MLSLDLWSLASDSTSPGGRDAFRQHLTFKDALQWLRVPMPPADQQQSAWRVEVLTAHVENLKRYIIPLNRLVSALGFEPEDASTVADTVVFNSYLEDALDDDQMSRCRRYYLSDNTFGVYWSWDPYAKCTKVFMYGMTGEGTRQMQQLWMRISATPTSRLSSPILVGTAALEAEVSEMKRWIAGQSDELVKLHIQTGHQGYARIEPRDVDTASWRICLEESAAPRSTSQRVCCACSAS